MESSSLSEKQKEEEINRTNEKLLQKEKEFKEAEQEHRKKIEVSEQVEKELKLTKEKEQTCNEKLSELKQRLISETYKRILQENKSKLKVLYLKYINDNSEDPSNSKDIYKDFIDEYFIQIKENNKEMNNRISNI